MNVCKSFFRAVSAFLAIATATDCEGALRSAFPEAPPQNPISAKPTNSWSTHETTTALLYVVDIPAAAVDIFTYPAGKRVGTLTGFEIPQGSCVDPVGDVFVTDEELREIREYAHGGDKPIAVLSELHASPIDCAVDPSTNNLAVANFSSTQHRHTLQGDIAIYSQGKEIPKVYSNPDLFSPEFCTYDRAGNLFVTGKNFSGGFIYTELPKASRKFTNIRLKGIQGSGIEWDGRYIAMAIGRGRIDRLSGSKVVGSTLLKGSAAVGKPWIGGSALVMTKIGSEVGFWKYPSAGKPTGEVSGFDEPYSVVVSAGKREIGFARYTPIIRTGALPSHGSRPAPQLASGSRR